MFKNKILQNEAVYGVWQRIPSPLVSEILACTGVDFVTVDMEHGAIDIADLRTMVPIFRRMGLPVIVRVASTEPAFLTKTLDLGVDGIMVPAVQSAEQARRIVNASKFAPLGARGVGGPCAADRFGEVSVDEFVARENNRVLTIVQIENREGVEQLDEILGVDGLDLIYIGPFDLSQSLGITGQLDHPKLHETIQTILNKANAAGKPVGMHGATTEFLSHWRDQGVRYFTYGMDASFLRQSVQLAFEAIQ